MRRGRTTSEGERETDTFLRMARQFPARTAIFTFGLPAFALLQVVNVLVNDGSIAFVGLFAALVVVHSVRVTRYHVAAYRRETLTRRLVEDANDRTREDTGRK